MGKAVIHAGDAGAGQGAKICNNMLLGASMVATCETLALAQKLGLDPQKFFDIASVSSGQILGDVAQGFVELRGALIEPCVWITEREHRLHRCAPCWREKTGRASGSERVWK